MMPLEIDEELQELIDKYCFTKKEITRFWKMYLRTDDE